MTTIRKAFEDAAFKQYFISSIVRNPNPPKIPFGGFDLIATADKPQDEFTAKREDGLYVDDNLNAAWWAWQKATEQSRKIIDEVHSWIVCAAIASPEDLMQNAERIVQITAPVDDGLGDGL